MADITIDDFEFDDSKKPSPKIEESNPPEIIKDTTTSTNINTNRYESFETKEKKEVTTKFEFPFSNKIILLIEIVFVAVVFSLTIYKTITIITRKDNKNIPEEHKRNNENNNNNLQKVDQFVNKNGLNEENKNKLFYNI